MKKGLMVPLIVILAVVFVFGAAKDTIVRVSVEKGTEAVTGLKLKMKGINVGIIKTMVGIKDLKLYNPPGYEDKVMLDMPEIYVDYDLGAIIGGKIHLPEVRIHLKEFMVVKNRYGELNLDSLKVVKDAEEEKEEKAPAEKPAKKEGKAPELQIDVLELKIGKVVYKDYSKGGEPEVKEFNINIDERYENIDDPSKLVSLIVVKALTGTSIGNLTNFDVGALEGGLGDTLASAQEVMGQAQVQATETASKAVGQAQDAAKKAADEAAESVKEMFKSPFGEKK